VTRRVRVLLVDAATPLRAAIAAALGNDERFELAGEARDGRDVVHHAVRLKPDVIAMQYDVARFDAARATRALLELLPVPIVLLSAAGDEAATQTVRALAAGAVDFVLMPEKGEGVLPEAAREQLAEKLLAATQVDLTRIVRPVARSLDSARFVGRHAARLAPAPVSVLPRRRATSFRRGPTFVVLAAGAGAPAALVRIVPRLRLTPEAGLLIVVHMSPALTRALARELDDQASFPVREALDGEPFAGGEARMAPGGAHLVAMPGASLKLEKTPAVHGLKPAADVTLNSVARHFGAQSIGVVLTGAGRDGAMGLAALKAAGGRTIAQDRSTSIVYGMPKAAVDLGVVDSVAPLERVADLVNRLLGPEL
jgi:two-component system chemotaxis response regulator CheB